MNIVAAIKRKKELRGLSDTFVEKEVAAYKLRNPKVSFANPRSQEFKQAVKEIRSRLRKVYGLFREEAPVLKNLSHEEQIMIDILNSHASTRERLPYYRDLYQQIWKITKKPKKILDVGCGINPFSFPFMGLKKVEYYCYDLSDEETAAVNKYFSLIKVNGKALVRDVLTLQRFPKVDVVFLWKMTDMLDQGKGHKRTENVLTKFNASFVVVSFATKTMSGKAMNVPRRPWFERLCNRLSWQWTTLEFPNELFYVVKK